MPLFRRKEKIPLGIYVHIPFCRSKCQYCDFYSLTTKDDKLLDSYIDREAGKPTVVPDTDKRQAYDRLAEAQKDFD